MSKAILLNGTSSSGKTSIAIGLQRKMPSCFLHFQLDSFWDMVPENIEDTTENFPKLKYAVIQSAKALMDTGHDLIIDAVFMPEDMKQAIFSWQEHDVFKVLVKATPETLQQREVFRGDRKIGLSLSQYKKINKDIGYNLQIDTTNQDVSSIIESILLHHRTQ